MSGPREFLGMYLLAPLLGMLARYGRPRAAGRLMGAMVARVSGARPPASHGPAPVRLLTLPKPGFTQDAIAAFGNDPQFALLGFNRAYVKAPYPAFLPPLVDDNNYRSAPAEFDAAKAQLRAFWVDAWGRIQDRAKADAVLTGNFGYFAEQELAAAVDRSGVPFIAMHKESLKTPGLVDFFTRLYRDRRQPFAGRKILVYNEIERGIQIAAGIAPPDRVEVCGMPRLDRVHQWRAAAASASSPSTGARPQVLFLSFHPKTGMPVIPRKPGAAEGRLEALDDGLRDVSWRDLFRQCHQTVLRLARENPAIDVVIKGKGDLGKWLGLTGASIGRDRPANLKLVVGGDPQDLIARASVVCGFTTTALLEAIAAGKPVVVPRFAEAAVNQTRPYFLDLGAAVEHAASAGDLYGQLLARAVPPVPPSPELSPHASEVLDHWAGNSDGRAGGRVCAAVLAEISGRKAAAE